MALIERLMGLNSDGSVPANAPDRPRIPVHDFHAGCMEVVSGRLTVAQLKTGLSMDANDEVDFNALIALAPNGSSALAIAQKAMYVISVHSVLLLAGRYAGYATPADIRAKLGLGS